ncbi:hypothetical protein I3843_10G130600 [Carya illinoinensis]|nr:hypothetical protein I3843_10G130600 [Carya illinoinensis]
MVWNTHPDYKEVSFVGLLFNLISISHSSNRNQASILMIPSIFRCRSNIFDPFSLEMWDPFEGFHFPQGSEISSSSEMSLFEHAKVDWKETWTAHTFKADVRGLKKEEVKVEVEVEEGEERNRENEQKNDT